MKLTMLKICRRALGTAAVILALLLSGLTIVSCRRGFTYTYMRAALWILLVGAAFMLALGVVIMLLRWREEPEKEKLQRMMPYREREMAPQNRNILRGAVIALAVLLIVLGIANGGLWDVLVKAINICTECIGLG